MDIPVNWTFESNDIAGEFDRHVREQLPWYELASGAVAHVVRHYLPDNGLVYDIGASTGNIAKIIEQTVINRNARIIGIEKSQQMADKYIGPGECIVSDAIGFEFEEFDVAICFLVLMFMTPGLRYKWVQSLARKMKPGGALIIVDKLSAPSGYLGTVLHRMTLAGKVASGVSGNNIVAKELSLAGVQRPIDISLINNIDPMPIEIFRFGEFAGWVSARPEH